MSVKEIVKGWLAENGHDGLCTNGCGCGLDDLMPCCSEVSTCEPAKKVIATEELVNPEWSEFEVGDEIYVPSNDQADASAERR